MYEVKFTTLKGDPIYFSRSLAFLPRIGESVSFPINSNWWKVTAVYHEIGDITHTNSHILIVEKM